MLLFAVRGAGERTQSLCVRALEDQKGPSQLCLVIEKPFWKSLVACFEKAIADRDCQFLICWDADVLPAQGIVGRLERWLGSQKAGSGASAIYTGAIYDMFFSGFRQGGIHVYPHTIFPQALKILPSLRHERRPETALKKRLVQSNKVSSKQLFTLCGYHDFEQYNADLIRKYFSHLNKHFGYGELFQDSLNNPSLRHDVRILFLYREKLRNIIDQEDLVYLNAPDMSRHVADLGLLEKHELPCDFDISSITDAHPSALNRVFCFGWIGCYLDGEIKVVNRFQRFIYSFVFSAKQTGIIQTIGTFIQFLSRKLYETSPDAKRK